MGEREVAGSSQSFPTSVFRQIQNRAVSSGSFDGKPLVPPLSTSLRFSHIVPPQTQDDPIKLP